MQIMWIARLEKSKRKKSRMWCHQCKSSKFDMMDCNKCKMKKYCVKCAEKWYPVMFEETLFEACPLCCNNCNCKKCLGLTNNLNDFELNLIKMRSCSRHSQHIIQTLLPIVKRFSEEQMCEKNLEAMIQDQYVVSIQGGVFQNHPLLCRCSKWHDIVKDCSFDSALPAAKNLENPVSRDEDAVTNEGKDVEHLCNHLSKDVLDCSNWCQVSMNSFQFFKRYIEVPFDSNGQPQLLKLHDCSHSVSFEERHYYKKLLNLCCPAIQGSHTSSEAI
ncbi:hypothetical protein Leryth_026434 [Lithospermum erythrorhizon]|nr:hypothetical protein Leryth_026434 [Lithospermum erythrorhizon]